MIDFLSLGKEVCIFCCYYYFFFFQSGETASTVTSSDNKILGPSASVSVNMLPQKWSILATLTARNVQKSFSVITYFCSIENTFDSLLTQEKYHFIEGIFTSSNWAAGNFPWASLKHIFFIYNGKEVYPIILSDIKMYFSLTDNFKNIPIIESSAYGWEGSICLIIITQSAFAEKWEFCGLVVHVFHSRICHLLSHLQILCSILVNN